MSEYRKEAALSEAEMVSISQEVLLGEKWKGTRPGFADFKKDVGSVAFLLAAFSGRSHILIMSQGIYISEFVLVW